MDASPAEGEAQWRLIRDGYFSNRLRAVKIGPDDPRWYRRIKGVYATEQEAQAAARTESHTAFLRWKRADELLKRGQKRNPLSDAATMWKRVMKGMPEITKPDVGYKQGKLRLSYTYQMPTGHKVRVNLKRTWRYGITEADPIMEQDLLASSARYLRYHAARAAGMKVATVQREGSVMLIPTKRFK